MHNIESVKPTLLIRFELFNIFTVNELYLFFIKKGVILHVCKFIYKEIFIGNDIRSYNKYLCRLKVISFTA